MVSHKDDIYPPVVRSHALHRMKLIGIRRTHEELHIPISVLTSWRSGGNRNVRIENEVGGQPIAKIAETSTRSIVKAKVEQILAERSGSIAAEVDATVGAVLSNLRLLVAESVDKARIVIREGPGARDTKAQWLNAVGQIMETSVKQQQLLQGLPTDITKHTEHKTLIGRIEQYSEVYDKLKDRSVEGQLLSSSDASDDSGEPVD